MIQMLAEQFNVNGDETIAKATGADSFSFDSHYQQPTYACLIQCELALENLYRDAQSAICEDINSIESSNPYEFR